VRARTYFKNDDVCVLQHCFCAVEHAALSTFDINLIAFVGLEGQRAGCVQQQYMHEKYLMG
jgi:hypothetical protein